jgi:hypothetical protein
MHRFLFLISTFLTLHSSSQNLALGKFYTLPYGSDGLKETTFNFYELTITKDSFSQKYLDNNFNFILNEYTKRIDSSFFISNSFYVIYKEKNGFTFREFILDKLDKNNPIKMKDNFVKIDFETIKDVDGYINYLSNCNSNDHSYCFPGTYMPFYTRKAILNFKNLKSLEKIDSTHLINILQKIDSQMAFENQIRDSLKSPSLDKYDILRHHSLSYKTFFIQEKISPFFSDNALQKLEKKYSNNEKIADLFNQIRRKKN